MWVSSFGILCVFALAQLTWRIWQGYKEWGKLDHSRGWFAIGVSTDLFGLAYVALGIYYLIVVYPYIQIRSTEYYLHYSYADSSSTNVQDDLDSVDAVLAYNRFSRVRASPACS